MARIGIYKGTRPSNGAQNLRNELRKSNDTARVLLGQGSLWSGRDGDLLINWGTRVDEVARLRGQATLLNQPGAVAIAGNKLTCLERLNEENVSIVPFYRNINDALVHINDGGGRIYARTVLNGHSGEGIKLILRRDDPQARLQLPDNAHFTDDHLPREIVEAQLFTIGMVGNRWEFRAHVVRGEPVLIQKKLRRTNENGEVDGGNPLIRNLASGWVYSVNADIPQDIRDGITREAVLAVEALGLDFGAVDLIQPLNGGSPRVLEVNTAPGLEGETTLKAYCDAFLRIAQ